MVLLSKIRVSRPPIIRSYKPAPTFTLFRRSTDSSASSSDGSLAGYKGDVFLADTPEETGLPPVDNAIVLDGDLDVEESHCISSGIDAASGDVRH